MHLLLDAGAREKRTTGNLPSSIKGFKKNLRKIWHLKTGRGKGKKWRTAKKEAARKGKKIILD